MANRFDSRYKTQPSTACAFERGAAITINALKTFRRHSQARLELMHALASARGGPQGGDPVPPVKNALNAAP